jgi:N-methylhydantoinase A
LEKCVNSQAKRVRVCTDVGGTFTDLVYFETDPASGKGVIRTSKVDTTPPNFEEGILDVLRKADVDIGTINSFAHGTTVVINAITERRGAKVGLVTTSGFRDVLEIARGTRPDFFNLRYAKPEPFVPRYLRREIGGRMRATGEIVEELDLADLGPVLEDFRAEGVEAIAVCLLHSYANAEHERRVTDEIKRLWPEVSVVASTQITREWREYERTNTAVLSAYVQPIATRYLTRLEKQLTSHGYDGQIYVMQSNCGIDTVAHARDVPITMVESGPASGMWGAAALGALIGEPNIIALDIGGTTAKCSLVKDGQVQIKTDYYIERDRVNAGYPIMVPVIDLVEIGNGGGSIAWIDRFGKMHVGPKSAGASPGPAAYGRGGSEATTTDANLALGRINPDYFCGGEIVADVGAVNSALDKLAAPLGLERIEVARGIVRLADSNMVNALKLISLNRGHDPRDFTLVAFGGGGGMHAVSLARELGIKKVIIPRGASVFSAWGMMMSDLRRDYFLTRFAPVAAADTPRVVQDLFDEVAVKARAEYGQENIHAADLAVSNFVKLRYENQEHAVEVAIDNGQSFEHDWQDVVERFHEEYERQYTYRLDAPVEVIGIHVVAFAAVGKLEPAEISVTGAPLDAARKGTREVDYDLEGVQQAAIYDNEKLEPSMRISGPAIIEDPGTTIVVFPADEVVIDRLGNIHIQTA